jgi:hypothetical protein
MVQPRPIRRLLASAISAALLSAGLLVGGNLGPAAVPAHAGGTSASTNGCVATWSITAYFGCGVVKATGKYRTFARRVLWPDGRSSWIKLNKGSCTAARLGVVDSLMGITEAWVECTAG